MDNASKALIIAGSILIAVALVSLGVYLFSMGRDVAENTSTQIDTLAMQLQNEPFTTYSGNKIRGTEVKSLLDLVNSTNVAKSMPDDIDVTGVTQKADVRETGFYTVTVTDANTNGYIDTINISKND